MPECEHGDPHPGRCALCRRSVLVLTQPWKYRDTRCRDQETGLPRPVWFDAMVEAARREDATDDD